MNNALAPFVWRVWVEQGSILKSIDSVTVLAWVVVILAWTPLAC